MKEVNLSIQGFVNNVMEKRRLTFRGRFLSEQKADRKEYQLWEVDQGGFIVYVTTMISTAYIIRVAASDLDEGGRFSTLGHRARDKFPLTINQALAFQKEIGIGPADQG